MMNQRAQECLTDYEILDITESEILVQLDMPNPLEVSNGDEPDKLFYQLDLGELESKVGKKMPDSLVKYFEVPR